MIDPRVRRTRSSQPFTSVKFIGIVVTGSHGTESLFGEETEVLSLRLAYVWGGGPLRGRDACGELAYFPRFFERLPAFFPENRSDNISLRLAGIIGICP